MAATPYAASFNGSGYYEAVACWLKALPPTTNLDNTKHPLPTYIRRCSFYIVVYLSNLAKAC